MFFRLYSVLLLAMMLQACTEVPYNNLDNNQLKAMLKQDVLIFDVRRPDEWRQTGIVEDSELLTFVDANGRLNPDFISQFTSTVGKHDPVILICRTGNRTSKLARYLVEEMGYTNVYNVRNGIMQWIRDKQPVQYL